MRRLQFRNISGERKGFLCFLIAVLCSFSSSSQSLILQVDLANLGAVPATNRQVAWQQASPFVGNWNYAVSDPLIGQVFITNPPVGPNLQVLYPINFVVQSPPGQKIQFQVTMLPGDSGTIDASNRLTSPSPTFPAGQISWAVATSDTRYALSTNQAGAYATQAQVTNIANVVYSNNTALYITTNVWLYGANWLNTNLQANLTSTGTAINASIGTLGANVTNGYNALTNQYALSAGVAALVSTNRWDTNGAGAYWANVASNGVFSSGTNWVNTQGFAGGGIASNLVTTNILYPNYALIAALTAGTQAVLGASSAALVLTNTSIQTVIANSTNGTMGAINTASNFLANTKQPGNGVLTNLAATGAFTNGIVGGQNISLSTNGENQLVIVANGQTNGQTSIVFSNPAAYYQASNPNGYISTVPASATNWLYPNSNPSNFIMVSAVPASLTNGLYPSNNPSGFVTYASGLYTNGIAAGVNVQLATNAGVVSIGATNQTFLTNGIFGTVSNIASVNGQTVSNGIVASSQYANAVTNGNGTLSPIVSVANNIISVPTNYDANGTAALYSMANSNFTYLVAAANSNNTASQFQSATNIGNAFATNVAMAVTNGGNIVWTSNPQVVLALTNGTPFVAATNGIGMNLTVTSNFLFGGWTNLQATVNVIGIRGSTMACVNGPYEGSSPSWTNYLFTNLIINYSGGNYYVQSNTPSGYVSFYSSPALGRPWTIVAPNGQSPAPYSSSVGEWFHVNNVKFVGTVDATNLVAQWNASIAAAGMSSAQSNAAINLILEYASNPTNGVTTNEVQAIITSYGYATTNALQATNAILVGMIESGGIPTLNGTGTNLTAVLTFTATNSVLSIVNANGDPLSLSSESPQWGGSSTAQYGIFGGSENANAGAGVEWAFLGADNSLIQHSGYARDINGAGTAQTNTGANSVILGNDIINSNNSTFVYSDGSIPVQTPTSNTAIFIVTNGFALNTNNAGGYAMQIAPGLAGQNAGLNVVGKIFENGVAVLTNSSGGGATVTNLFIGGPSSGSNGTPAVLLVGIDNSTNVTTNFNSASVAIGSISSGQITASAITASNTAVSGPTVIYATFGGATNIYSWGMIPDMTSLTSPSGTVTGFSPSPALAWTAFSTNLGEQWNTGTNSATLEYSFPPYQPICGFSMSIWIYTAVNSSGTVTFQGTLDGNTWITLASGSWSNVSDTQQTANVLAFCCQSYRWIITANQNIYVGDATHNPAAEIGGYAPKYTLIENGYLSVDGPPNTNFPSTFNGGAFVNGNFVVSNGIVYGNLGGGSNIDAQGVNLSTYSNDTPESAVGYDALGNAITNAWPTSGSSGPYAVTNTSVTFVNVTATNVSVTSGQFSGNAAGLTNNTALSGLLSGSLTSSNDAALIANSSSAAVGQNVTNLALNVQTNLLSDASGNFVAAANSLAFTTWPGAVNTGIGSSVFSAFGGTEQSNTAVGSGTLSQLSGRNWNTAIGAEALAPNDGTANTAVGAGAGPLEEAGNYNTVIGAFALGNVNILAGGNSNIVAGYQSGINYTNGESFDITIGSPGVGKEWQTIRIGTPGVQTNTFIAGQINGNAGGLTNLIGNGGSITNVNAYTFGGQQTNNISFQNIQATNLTFVAFPSQTGNIFMVATNPGTADQLVFGHLTNSTEDEWLFVDTNGDGFSFLPNRGIANMFSSAYNNFASASNNFTGNVGVQGTIYGNGAGETNQNFQTFNQNTLSNQTAYAALGIASIGSSNVVVTNAWPSGGEGGNGNANTNAPTIFTGNFAISNSFSSSLLTMTTNSSGVNVLESSGVGTFTNLTLNTNGTVSASIITNTSIIEGTAANGGPQIIFGNGVLNISPGYGNPEYKFNDGIYAASANTYSLGTASLPWANVYLYLCLTATNSVLPASVPGYCVQASVGFTNWFIYPNETNWIGPNGTGHIP